MSIDNSIIEINSLISNPESFGANLIDQNLLLKLENLSQKKLSHLFTREIFNGHIKFDEILDHVETGKPLYIYIPITPTDRLTHLRHILFFQLAKYLQECFKCYVFFHIMDTKAFGRDTNNNKWDVIQKWTQETIKDILCFEFDLSKTIILTNSNSTNLNYVLLCDMQRNISLGKFFNSFFKDDSVNAGILDQVFQVCACGCPEYCEKLFPDPKNTKCLLLLRSTQKPIFDLTNELCNIFNFNKPSAIFGGFVPALQSGSKMPKIAKLAFGNSNETKNGGIRDYMTIYLKNTSKEIQTKLNKSAFSGGKDSLNDQQELGANLLVDIPTFYLKLFEQDEEKYQYYIKYYGPGELPEGNNTRLASGNIKKFSSEAISKIIDTLQLKRNSIPKNIFQNLNIIKPFY